MKSYAFVVHNSSFPPREIPRTFSEFPSQTILIPEILKLYSLEKNISSITYIKCMHFTRGHIDIDDHQEEFDSLVRQEKSIIVLVKFVRSKMEEVVGSKMVFGIKNNPEDNLCFINSALQCLLWTPGFLSRFWKLPLKSKVYSIAKKLFHNVLKRTSSSQVNWIYISRLNFSRNC
jgi:hypothetical protein